MAFNSTTFLGSKQGLWIWCNFCMNLTIFFLLLHMCTIVTCINLFYFYFLWLFVIFYWKNIYLTFWWVFSYWQCLSLLLWLEERYETVYTRHPGFQKGSKPLMALDNPFPMELPENLFGDKWAFVQLPFSGTNLMPNLQRYTLASGFFN